METDSKIMEKLAFDSDDKDNDLFNQLASKDQRHGNHLYFTDHSDNFHLNQLVRNLFYARH